MSEFAEENPLIKENETNLLVETPEETENQSSDDEDEISSFKENNASNEEDSLNDDEDEEKTEYSDDNEDEEEENLSDEELLEKLEEEERQILTEQDSEGNLLYENFDLSNFIHLEILEENLDYWIETSGEIPPILLELCDHTPLTRISEVMVENLENIVVRGKLLEILEKIMSLSPPDEEEIYLLSDIQIECLEKSSLVGTSDFLASRLLWLYLNEHEEFITNGKNFSVFLKMRSLNEQCLLKIIANHENSAVLEPFFEELLPKMSEEEKDILRTGSSQTLTQILSI